MTDRLTRLAELPSMGLIGSAEMEVDGITVDGERIPVLRHLAWELGR
jgi:leucyl aminopeptidase (aminopeptidase T)